MINEGVRTCVSFFARWPTQSLLRSFHIVNVSGAPLQLETENGDWHSSQTARRSAALLVIRYSPTKCEN